MTLLTIAIPVALLVATAALVAFIWAARTDQFEDLDTPPRHMGERKIIITCMETKTK